jgi:hypothetical protein
LAGFLALVGTDPPLETMVRFFGAAFFFLVPDGVTTPVRTASFPNAVPIASAAQASLKTKHARGRVVDNEIR